MVVKKIMVCEAVLIHNIVSKYAIEKNFLHLITHNIFIENWYLHVTRETTASTYIPNMKTKLSGDHICKE